MATSVHQIGMEAYLILSIPVGLHAIKTMGDGKFWSIGLKLFQGRRGNLPYFFLNPITIDNTLANPVIQIYTYYCCFESPRGTAVSNCFGYR